jgi:hypothetical protein
VREPVKILACGPMSGSSSSEPAGIKTIPSCSTKIGTLPPQVRQNVLLKRSASGNLNLLINSSPLSQLSVPWRKRLLEWPAPVALRQREQ